MNRHLERARQVADAAQRRRQLAIWLETFERLQAVKPRSAEERQAQCEALELLRAAWPCPLGHIA